MVETGERSLDLVLLTIGDSARLTGGYLYNRRVVRAMCDAGWRVTEIALRDFPREDKSVPNELMSPTLRVAIVDSIAVDAAAPLLQGLGERAVKVIALMHMLPSDLAPARRRGTARAMEAALWEAADMVVAVSPYLGERLLAAGVQPERLAVIPPGRDGVTAAETQVRRSSGAGCRFLCVANWSQKKGIHLLVEAMVAVAGASLDLVGDTGTGQYARRIRGLLEAEGMKERVCVAGVLEGERLAERYVAADVFVLPSRTEGFGTAYAEAMHWGLPVIGCNVGPLPWLVEEGCGKLVKPDDAEGLAGAMTALAANAALRREMGTAARRRAARLPRWRVTEEAFVSLVGGLVDGLD